MFLSLCNIIGYCIFRLRKKYVSGPDALAKNELSQLIRITLIQLYAYINRVKYEQYFLS